MQNENYSNALVSFQKAAEIQDSKVKAYLYMAFIYDEHLNDVSNAVKMYQSYLEHETNNDNKERAKRWLAEVLHVNDTLPSPPTRSTALSVSPSNSPASDQTIVHARHFDILRNQLTEEYENRLADVKAQLWSAQENIAKLREQNNMLEKALHSGDSSELVARIESNELYISTLRTQLEEKENENEEFHKGQDILQSLITNLQVQLVQLSAVTSSQSSVYSDYVKATNTISSLQNKVNALNYTTHIAHTQYTQLHKSYISATTEIAQITHSIVPQSMTTHTAYAALQKTNDVLQSEIAILKNSINKYDADMRTANANYITATAALVRAESVAATVKTTEIVHTATPLYNSLTGTIAALEMKLAFREQERENLISTVNALRTEIEQKETTITNLHARVEEGIPAPALVQKVNELTEEVARAKATTSLEKKQTETLQQEMEKVRNGYVQLRQEYEKEVAERKRLSTVIARLRRELGTQNTVDTPPPPRIILPDSTPATRTADETRSYTVQSGDSLTKISEKFYGTQADWRRIFDANRDKISRPNQLRVGMVIRIP